MLPWAKVEESKSPGEDDFSCTMFNRLVFYTESIVTTEETSSCLSPSWCGVQQRRRISGVNVVVVEGLTQSHFYKHYVTLKHLRTNYTSVSN